MPVLLIFLPLFDILFNNNKKSKSHSGSEFQQVANGSELNFSSIFDLIVFIFVIYFLFIVLMLVFHFQVIKVSFQNKKKLSKKLSRLTENIKYTTYMW